MPTAKFIDFKVLGIKRIMGRMNRISANVPKKTGVTCNKLADIFIDEAKKIIKAQEATFNWSGKGELGRSLTKTTTQNSRSNTVVEVTPVAPYASEVETGLESTWKNASDPKLASWLKSARVKARRVRVSASESFDSRPVAWGPTGMKFMEHGFDIMRKEGKSYIDSLPTEIVED